MSAKIEIVGKRFGRLFVVDEAERKGTRIRSLCHCDCGAWKVIANVDLRSGNTKSCGCFAKEQASKASKKNYTGKTFGKLTVISQAESLIMSNGKPKVRWHCQCACGNTSIVYGTQLTSGKTKSCGCLRDTPKTSPGEVGYKTLLTRYRYGAASRNLPFELSDTEFKEIISGACHYCGTAPSLFTPHSLKTMRNKEHAACVANGIDRIDSTIGYVVSNCLSCCAACNQAKLDLSYDQFLNLVTQIYNNRIKKD